MKKLLVVAIIILFVWGCSHKTAPSTQTSSTQSTSTSTAAAAGKETYVAKCQRCHSLKNPANYTTDQWVPILNNMAAKANLSDDEKANVMAYVDANAKQ